MKTHPAEHADDQFFAALRAADVERLEQLLAEDFLIVMVAGGSVPPDPVKTDRVLSPEEPERAS